MKRQPKGVFALFDVQVEINLVFSKKSESILEWIFIVRLKDLEYPV